MRRGHRKMWWSVPCTSRKSLRTESRKGIEEILNSKLATIIEEPEMYEENRTLISSHHLRMAKKQGNKKMMSTLKVKMGKFGMPHFSLKDSYFLLFINGVVPKGRPAGLPQP